MAADASTGRARRAVFARDARASTLPAHPDALEGGVVPALDPPRQIGVKISPPRLLSAAHSSRRSHLIVPDEPVRGRSAVPSTDHPAPAVVWACNGKIVERDALARRWTAAIALGDGLGGRVRR